MKKRYVVKMTGPMYAEVDGNCMFYTAQGKRDAELFMQNKTRLYPSTHCELIVEDYPPEPITTYMISLTESDLWLIDEVIEAMRESYYHMDSGDDDDARAVDARESLAELDALQKKFTDLTTEKEKANE